MKGDGDIDGCSGKSLDDVLSDKRGERDCVDLPSSSPAKHIAVAP